MQGLEAWKSCAYSWWSSKTNRLWQCQIANRWGIHELVRNSCAAASLAAEPRLWNSMSWIVLHYMRNWLVPVSTALETRQSHSLISIITTLSWCRLLSEEPRDVFVNGRRSRLSKKAGSLIGTADYVSPEMLESKPLTYAADLWSLGCCIYQMLAGRPPFRDDSEYLTFERIVAWWAMRVRHAWLAGVMHRANNWEFPSNWFTANMRSPMIFQPQHALLWSSSLYLNQKTESVQTHWTPLRY